MKKYISFLLMCLLIPSTCLALSITSMNEDISAYWSYQSETQQHEVSINAPIFTPHVDHLPILRVKLHQLNEGYMQDEFIGPDLQYLNYNRLASFNFSKRMEVSEGVGRPYNCLVFENIWQTEADFEEVYAENQSMSLSDAIEKYNTMFNELLSDVMITAIPFKAWIRTPYLNVKPGTYEYGVPSQFGKLTGVGGYSIEYWPAIRDIPVVMCHDMAYDGSNNTILQQRLSIDSALSVNFLYSNDHWSFGGRMLWEEIGVYSEDYVLCSFERIEETLKTLIESGKIKDVFSIILGYVVYADPSVKYENTIEEVSAQEFVAIPTWIVEAIYTENPNRDYPILPDNGDPTVYTYSSHIAYMKLNISAQTGKLYDPSDTSKDRVYSKDKWQ